MASHLSGGRLNVALLQEQFRKELINIIEKCEGPKAMIWDGWLAGPVGLVAQYSLLREYDLVDMYPLKRGVTTPANVKHVIFITRPIVKLIDIVAENIHSASKSTSGPKKEFHLIFLPRRSQFCEERLKSSVLGSLSTINEFKCDIFPFDNDLLSLELENDFRDVHLDGDPSSLFLTAQAIMKLQRQYGTIPKVLGKGNCAKQVWELLGRLSREEQAGDNRPRGPSQGCVDVLLLLDRSIDLATVFSTQLTYEGLIDELFGIKSTTAQFPAEKFLSAEEQSTSASKTEKKRIILNSGEELFAELRDKNFTSVGPALSRKARQIHNQLGEKQNNKSVQEIKQFVSRLPYMLANKQSLATHTTIAEYIKEITDTFEFHDNLQCEEDFLNCIDTDKVSPYIEDLIAQKAPLVKVLRLICLQCVTGSGLKPKVLEYYKREIVQVYGLNSWLGLCNLEKVGILKPQSGSRPYTVLRKSLRLTVDETVDGEIKERSYLQTTYTPLTVRLCDHVAKNRGWFGLQDVIGLLGPTLEEMQAIPHGQNRRSSVSSENSSISDATKVILVFFIGGCTYSEIAALRMLSQQEDSNVDFIIATTKLINGTTFLDSLMEPMPE